MTFSAISADLWLAAGGPPRPTAENGLVLLPSLSDLPELPADDAGGLASDLPGQGREVVRSARLPSRPNFDQRVLFCRCGSTSIYVRGLCQRCYHRERADQRHFAGRREKVLARDEHRCRGCQAEAIDSVLSVHHREPGRSSLDLLVTLCPRCHALVERTQVLFRDVPELLRVLWRERHPAASEQMALFTP